MKITRLGHACVRIDDGHDRPVVVDPGAFSDPDAVRGARAVLVTHEHMDHFQPDRLRQALDEDPTLQVWTNRSVAEQLDGPAARVHVVGNGDVVDLDGLEVQVHGELHELIHLDIPRAVNVGFLLGGAVFHPGDAFTLPGVPVDTLLLPMHGPWSKTGEVIDYVRAVAPRQALPIHDGLLVPPAVAMIGTTLTNLGAPYQAVATGETVEG